MHQSTNRVTGESFHRYVELDPERRREQAERLRRELWEALLQRLLGRQTATSASTGTR